jgi:hypothetical protein
MSGHLLELEEQHSLWEAEVDDLKLWPLVRFFLLNELVMSDLGYAPQQPPNRKTYFAPGKWRRYLRTLPFLIAPKQETFAALFWVVNVHRYPVDANYSFDRRYSEFYDSIDRPLIFESAPTGYVAKPDRQVEPYIFSQDILWIMAMAHSRLQPLAPSANHQIKEFAEFLARLYDAPHLQTRLASSMQRLAGLYRTLRPILTKHIAPRLKHPLVIMEDSHYMGRNALVTKTFHDLGFHIAEPQHGMINSIHYAYQYPLSCFQPEHPCRTYLPDTLLTYGNYWSNVVNTPAEKIVVGLPYLTKTAQRLTSKGQGKQILVLSSWVISEATSALGARLAEAFPDWTLVFKLHPLENSDDPAYTPLQEFTNIQVVTRADVYQLVAESDVIICLYSTTVLIEATIFPGKRIFFQELGTLPPDIGEHFSDTDELINLIKDPGRGLSRCQPDDFWASDWQHNLSQFLDRHLSNPIGNI